MCPIIASDKSRDFKPAPEGLHNAVVVDVIDHGMQEGRFGRKHKVEIRWQIEEINPDNGKPFLAMRRYTLSLNSKATLRLHVEALRNSKKFTKKELAGFDLEELIGLGCQLQIVHNTTDDGRTFGNVQACVPLSKGMRRLKPVDYVRVQDRPENGTASVGASNDVPDDDDDDDVTAQQSLDV